MLFDNAMGMGFHLPSVARALLLSCSVLLFSYFTGPLVFQIDTIEFEESSNPSRILTQQLESSMDQLFYADIFVSTLTDFQEGQYTSFVPKHVFTYNLNQLMLGKNVVAEPDDIIYLNDSRLDTGDWFISPSPCCDGQIQIKTLASIDTITGAMHESLIEDLNIASSYSNITGNLTMVENQILSNSIGQEYWDIFLFYRNNLSLRIQAYGSQLLVIQYEINFVRSRENGFAINFADKEPIVYVAVLQDPVFYNFHSVINNTLSDIYGIGY